MIVNKLEIKAVIPTGSYENLQPAVSLENVDLAEGTDVLMNFISNLFYKYSSNGGLKEKESIKIVATKKSFNEDVDIQFDSIAHTYSLNGVLLTSATSYIKKFYKEFDAENISKVSANAWGVEQEDVKQLWKSNGKLTADFGTVIHSALEHYEKFRQLGKIVSDKKELLENYALPKHPFLRSIIDGFNKVNTTNGIVITEALITDKERGYCGHADRILILDIDKKICRIQDYKVNIDSLKEESNMKAKEPFNELPANKITKYQLQMSFYANMLEKSGWTVEGLDAFVFEDEWRHYPLEVLKVI